MMIKRYEIGTFQCKRGTLDKCVEKRKLQNEVKMK